MRNRVGSSWGGCWPCVACGWAPRHGLLLPMRDRRRMWLFGGVFLATTAAFWLVLASWLNLVLLLWRPGWLGLAPAAP